VMSVLVVGSVALDTVETPHGRVVEALGGSATYFSLAASLYTPVRLVAVVGDDFPASGLQLLGEHQIDLSGLEVRPGRTFRWTGRYGEDLNTAETLDTQLNVFAHFDPKVPGAFRHTPLVFLANIDPELQLRVLGAVEGAQLTAMDTMNYWISSKRDAVTEVIRSVDIVLMNDAELRQYAQVRNLAEAARRVLALGPRAVVIKKGDNGCALFGRDGFFFAPAYPVNDVCDPTGAGDSFAGGFIGKLASSGDFSDAALRQAVLHGCVVASFTVESFSVDRIRSLQPDDVSRRLRELRSFIRVEEEVINGTYVENLEATH
jgi:sugar/nucleoside kinase (ribokinase family)